MEKTCSKLDSISGSLQKIKEGLNKHVGGLWSCVRQMNGTLRAHSRDIAGLKNSVQQFYSHVFQISTDLQDLIKFQPSSSSAEESSEAPLLRPEGPRPQRHLATLLQHCHHRSPARRRLARTQEGRTRASGRSCPGDPPSRRPRGRGPAGWGCPSCPAPPESSRRPGRPGLRAGWACRGGAAPGRRRPHPARARPQR